MGFVLKKALFIVVFYLAVQPAAAFAGDAVDLPQGASLRADLEPTPAEAACCGEALETIIEDYEAGRFVRVQEGVQALLIANPESAEMDLPRLLEAEALYFNGLDDPELLVRFAKPTYRDLAGLFPESSRGDVVHFRLGMIFMIQGYEPEALGQFELLAETHSDSVFRRLALLNAGALALALERPSKATTAYLDVEKDPDATAEERFRAAVGRALIEQQLGRLETAKAIFQTVVPDRAALDALDDNALFAFGELHLALGDVPWARDAFELLMERSPDLEFKEPVKFHLAQFLWDEGRHDEAREAWDKLIESGRDEEWSLRASLRVAQILRDETPGKFNPEAEENYRRVMDNMLYPELSMVALFDYADMLNQAREFDRALKACSNLLARPLEEEQRRKGFELAGAAFEGYVRVRFDEERYDLVADAFSGVLPLRFQPPDERRGFRPGRRVVLRIAALRQPRRDRAVENGAASFSPTRGTRPGARRAGRRRIGCRGRHLRRVVAHGIRLRGPPRDVRGVTAGDAPRAFF
ncbi:MAG: hypothetical protein M5R36_13380 [Deltaproteobacteria bacterium]|nr:hypothetical protein [Deltaproteobacteria bacterium]